jgi:hypothetical protein
MSLPPPNTFGINSMSSALRLDAKPARAEFDGAPPSPAPAASLYGPGRAPKIRAWGPSSLLWRDGASKVFHQEEKVKWIDRTGIELGQPEVVVLFP